MSGWQRIRVPAGFLFALLYLYFCRPQPLWLAVGFLVALGGMALRIWAAGHLKKWKGLAVSGPYRWTRNPLYLGSFTIGLGLSIASTQPLILILFLILFATLYIPVMKREEEELAAGYGRPYETYQRQVPLFLPTLMPAPDENLSGGNFRWRLVISNREYNAVLGLVGFFALVGLKMLWAP